jgi:predicted nucleic acid-binding protein
MYLIDTDVISELRKGSRANPGVRSFFANASRDEAALFLSAITVGEVRQGIERMRYRGDRPQAVQLEQWLERLTLEFEHEILPFDETIAQVWGRLRVPNSQNPLDKQIAATALTYDLTVVTRNTSHYEPTGVRCVNPFSTDVPAAS